MATMNLNQYAPIGSSGGSGYSPGDFYQTVSFNKNVKAYSIFIAYFEYSGRPTFTPKVWDSSGNLLFTGTPVSGHGITTTQWLEMPLPTPFGFNAGTTYRVGFTSTGAPYAINSNVGSGGVTDTSGLGITATFGGGYPSYGFSINNSTAPTGPTGLTPGATSAAPTILTTNTPKLQWTFNDSDSDPQGWFQVKIYRTSDNALLHDSTKVQSSNKYYDVPAGAIPTGTVGFYWNVATWDNVNLASPTASSVYCEVNAAPTVTSMNPNGTSASPTKLITTTPKLQWVFSDVNTGQSQRAFQVQIFNTAGTVVHDSGKVTASNSYYDVPSANALAASTTYYWKAQLWDTSDQTSGYSSSGYFYVDGAPNAPAPTTFNGTAGAPVIATTVTPALSWTFSDPDSGDTQGAYQIIIRDSTNLLNAVQASAEGTLGSANGLDGYAVNSITFRADTATKAQGTQSAFCQSTYAGTQTIEITTNGERTPVVAGKTYTFSVKTLISVSGGSKTVRAVLNWVNSAGGFISSNSQDATVNDQTWTLVSLTATAPTGSVTAYVSLQLLNANQFNAIYWDQAQLQLGDQATAWVNGDEPQVSDTGKLTGAVGSYSVPGVAGLQWDHVYSWIVKTWDQLDLAGAYSAPQYFLTNRAPAAPTGLTPGSTDITTPDGSNPTPRLQWTYSDPESETQSAFQVQIRNYTNLLTKNQADIETDTTGFTAMGSTTTLLRTTAEKWQGTASLRVTCPDASDFKGVRTTASISLTSGKAYTATVYMKGSGKVNLAVARGGGSWITSLGAQTLSTTWTRYTLTFTPTATASDYQICLEQQGNALASDFYADGLQIQEGNIATPFSPGGVAHDSGKLASANKYYDVPADALANGTKYGWFVRVWDVNDLQSADSATEYFLTNQLPAVPALSYPADTRRTTTAPYLEATIGNDPEDDGQHFKLQIAEDTAFTVNLQEFYSKTSQTGWNVKKSSGSYGAMPAGGVDATYEGGSIKYTVQTPLTEQKTYYWRMAAVDLTSGAPTAWSAARSIRVGDTLQFVLKNPVNTGSVKANRIVISMMKQLPTDGTVPAAMTIEVCNNALDTSPTWENGTTQLLSGQYYTFTNSTKTAASFAVGIRITIVANDSTGAIEVDGYGFAFD